jgi:Glycosyltransferase family 87
MGFNPGRKLYYILVSILIFILIGYFAFFFIASRLFIKHANAYFIGGDFIIYYVALKMAARGNIIDIYNIHIYQAEIAKYIGLNYFYWVYPPTILIILFPLALLPFFPAWLIWILLTLTAYLLVVHHIAPRPVTFLLTLAFPATYYNFYAGQNGFLSASLLGAGLLSLENRPLLGGILLGLVSYKPHFAILVPVALISGRQWRALLGAASSALGLVLISVAVFGPQAWLAFYRNIHLPLEFLASPNQPKIITLFSLLQGRLVAAWMLQGSIMLAAVAALIWGWRRGLPSLRNALLVLCTLLFTPYAFYYDLPILALPLAWIGWHGYTQGWLPGEQTILTLAWALPFLLLFSILFQINLNFPLAPLIFMALVILVLRRQYQR